MQYSGSSSTIFFLKLQNLKHFVKPWGLSEFGVVGNEKNLLTEKIGDLIF